MPLTKTFQPLILLVLGMFLFLSHTTPFPTTVNTSTDTFAPVDTIVIEYKGEIKSIIDQKCYDCHSQDGDDAEAREELLWEELPKLDPMDQVYTLDAIVESIEEGEMPPAKHLRWNPQKKLTREEAELLMEWAGDLSDKIYKGID